MTYTDEDLKSALRRREAPDGFTERVLARVANEHAGQSGSRRESWLGTFPQPILRWATVGLTTAALIVGGIHYRNMQRERARGEAAKQQLMLALRIAGNKLQLAKAKVNDIHVNEPKNRQVKE